MNKFLKRRVTWIGGGFFLLSVLLIYIVCLFFYGFYGGANFRTMQDKISSLENVDLKGMQELRASGGNRPRFFYVQRRLGHIKGHKVIINALGVDAHGYIKGIPTSFLAYPRTSLTWRYALRRLIWTGSTKIHYELVKSESEEAKQYGFEYKQFLIGSRFIAGEKVIDQFVTFIESLPENTWIHFHCAKGKGRTTTMLVLFDILKNAPHVALKDIVKRQHLLGGSDLFDTEIWTRGTYSQKQLDNRKKFIEDFYEFVCQRKAGGIKLWSEWNYQKKIGKA